MSAGQRPAATTHTPPCARDATRATRRGCVVQLLRGVCPAQRGRVHGNGPRPPNIERRAKEGRAGDIPIHTDTDKQGSGGGERGARGGRRHGDGEGGGGGAARAVLAAGLVVRVGMARRCARAQPPPPRDHPAGALSLASLFGRRSVVGSPHTDYSLSPRPGSPALHSTVVPCHLRAVTTHGVSPRGTIAPRASQGAGGGRMGTGTERAVCLLTSHTRRCAFRRC